MLAIKIFIVKIVPAESITQSIWSVDSLETMVCFIMRKINQIDHSTPKDVNGDEFAVRLIITSVQGFPIAARKRNGFVSYTKANGKEILYEYNNQTFFGINIFRNQQYPCNFEGDEYYPDFKIATDINGNLKYALDRNKIIIYLKYHDVESYIDNAEGSFVILKRHEDVFKEQAKQNDKFVYPKIILTDGKILEIFMNDMYAENEINKYYAMDSTNNGYINSSGDLLDVYPVTNDINIIVPNYQNRPLVKLTDKHLSVEIKYMLYLPNLKGYEFLLKKSSNKVLDSNIFTKWNLNYIMIAMCTILFTILFLIMINLR